MKIAIWLISGAISVISIFYAVDRQMLLTRANARISKLTEAENTARTEIEQLKAEVEAQKALTLKTAVAPSATDISEQLQIEDVAYKLNPEISLGDRGKKIYRFKHLVGRNGQLLAEDALFRELIGLSKFSFKTPDGIRYFDLNDLHPIVVSSLGFDVDVLNNRLAEDLRQRQLRGAQLKFQQEMRNKAAIEVLARERALSEMAKRDTDARGAAAKERLATAAEMNALNQQRPPEVNVKVINVPSQY